MRDRKLAQTCRRSTIPICPRRAADAVEIGAIPTGHHSGGAPGLRTGHPGSRRRSGLVSWTSEDLAMRRELIDTGRDKRFVRRDEAGRSAARM